MAGDPNMSMVEAEASQAWGQCEVHTKTLYQKIKQGARDVA